MARWPADEWVKLTARVPRGHQGYWQLIREAHYRDGAFTVWDIEGQTNADRKAVRDYIRRLEKAGIVAEAGFTERGEKVRRLISDPGPEAPRLRRDGSPARETGRGNEQLWRAARMLGQFTLQELSTAASTDEVQVSRETAKTYCRHLHRAGYLARVNGGEARRGETPKPIVYRLLPSAYTGPLAPQIQLTRFVFDPNMGRVVGPEGGAS